ncbi:ICAM2 protein, partial [Tachuris rubrigastra]|nr:ICAM2 protein [Tachuris rubrigastra]
LFQVTEGKSNPFFYYVCNGKREKKDVRLIIYHEPQQPELAEVPSLAAGQPWDLLCAVAGAAPLQNLTVRLRRGHHVLSARSFEGDGQEEPREVRVTQRVTLGAQDDG